MIKSFAWVKKPRENTFRFDANLLIDTLDFILDNSFFCFGSLIFRQIIGVPMGVDPGPFIANLTLWYYENKYLDKLYKVDYYRAKRINHTFRLIDDITTINSDGIFQEHVCNIYPDSLILNKENIDDTSAHVLDLEINIVEGKFFVEVYDKRDDFPFKIVQCVSKCSNVSRSSIIGVFGSQVIRFFRICNSFNGFKKRLETIVNAFITLGFEKKLLLNRYKYIDNKHGISNKFKLTGELECIFN